MKRILMLLAAGFAASILCACNGSAPTLTFPQAVTIACSSVNTEISTLQMSGVFTGGAQTTLTKQIQPDVAEVCAQGATVTTANLQNIVNATLPALTTIVSNSSLSSGDKTVAVLAIGGVGAAVNAAIALMPATTSTAAPASGTPAASAPAAASTPLAGAPLQ